MHDFPCLWRCGCAHEHPYHSISDRAGPERNGRMKRRVLWIVRRSWAICHVARPDCLLGHRASTCASAAKVSPCEHARRVSHRVRPTACPVYAPSRGAPERRRLLQVVWQLDPGAETFHVLRQALEVRVLIESLEVFAKVRQRLPPPHALAPLLRGQVRLGSALAPSWYEVPLAEKYIKDT